MALCRAWLVDSRDPIIGTEKTSAEFYATVVEAYRRGFKIPAVWLPRPAAAIARFMWCMLFKNVQLFAAVYARVNRRNMTGHLSGEDVIRGAEAEREAGDAYEAARAVPDHAAPRRRRRRGGPAGAVFTPKTGFQAGASSPRQTSSVGRPKWRPPRPRRRRAVADQHRRRHACSSATNRAPVRAKRRMMLRIRMSGVETTAMGHGGHPIGNPSPSAPSGPRRRAWSSFKCSGTAP